MKQACLADKSVRLLIDFCVYLQHRDLATATHCTTPSHDTSHHFGLISWMCLQLSFGAIANPMVWPIQKACDCRLLGSYNYTGGRLSLHHFLVVLLVDIFESFYSLFFFWSAVMIESTESTESHTGMIHIFTSSLYSARLNVEDTGMQAYGMDLRYE